MSKRMLSLRTVIVLGVYYYINCSKWPPFSSKHTATRYIKLLLASASIAGVMGRNARRIFTFSSLR